VAPPPRRQGSGPEDRKEETRRRCGSLQQAASVQGRRWSALLPRDERKEMARRGGFAARDDQWRLHREKILAKWPVAVP